MLKMNESQAQEFIAELAEKCRQRWKQTVDRTRFMDELREGSLKKETIQLFYVPLHPIHGMLKLHLSIELQFYLENAAHAVNRGK